MTTQIARDMAHTYFAATRAGAAEGRYADACIEAAEAHSVADWRAACDALLAADDVAYTHACDGLMTRESL